MQKVVVRRGYKTRKRRLENVNEGPTDARWVRSSGGKGRIRLRGRRQASQPYKDIHPITNNLKRGPPYLCLASTALDAQPRLHFYTTVMRLR